MEVEHMTQGERVREVRKTLGLTLEKFGEKIGMKKNSVSQIENGKNNVTDANVKAICREFNVDYIWLTTGEGEMFVDSDDDFIEKIDRIMAGESDIRKNAIKALVNASTEDIEALDRLIDLYLQAKNEKD
jgi:transcriptional regulator with XRE-family HTH domain